MNTPIRLVASSDANSALDSNLPPATMIVVTDKAPFERFFAERLGVDVFVVSKPDEVFNLLDQYEWRGIYADFRQLPGQYQEKQYSGQSIWRELRANPKHSHISFYILAEKWDTHQETWLVERMGVKQMVRRTPAAIAELISGKARAPESPELEFDLVNSTFRRMAGAMVAEPAIAEARAAIKLGRIANTQASYIEELARKLAGAKQEAFKRAVIPGTSKAATDSNPITSNVDPWIDQINKIFAKFAGGLGAKLVVRKALEEMAARPSMTRDDYLETLASSLFNRSSDFLDAVKQAKL